MIEIAAENRQLMIKTFAIFFGSLKFFKKFWNDSKEVKFMVRIWSVSKRNKTFVIEVTQIHISIYLIRGHGQNDICKNDSKRDEAKFLSVS